MRSNNPEALNNNRPLSDVLPIPVDRGGIPGFVAVTESGRQRFFTAGQYEALTQSRKDAQGIPTITKQAEWIEIPAQHMLGVVVETPGQTIALQVASKPDVHIPSVSEMRASYQEYISQMKTPKAKVPETSVKIAS